MSASAVITEHDGKIDYMDGLRAIAVLGVLAFHAGAATMDYHGNNFYHLLAEGGHGVDLFFVISGFCLAYPTVKKVTAGGAFSFDKVRYFARRIVRIYPPFIAVFAFMLVAGLIVQRAGLEPTVAIPTSLSDAFLQLTLIKPGGYLVGAFWTLPVELHWYVAFPLVLWLWARFPRAYYVALMAAAVILYRFVPGAHIIDIAALPCFMLGILAAELAVKRTISPLLAILGFACSVAAALWLEPKGHLNYIFPDQIWWQFACFAFVVAAGSVPLLRNILSLRWLTLIGACAYSIYLIHQPFTGEYGLYGGSSFVLAAAAGLLPGIAGWMFVERYVTTSPLREHLVSMVERAIRTLQRIPELVRPLWPPANPLAPTP